MSGEFNGNASLGTANAPGAKMAAQNGSCYGLKKQANNNEVLAWLMSLDNSNIPDPEDLDYDERRKSAGSRALDIALLGLPLATGALGATWGSRMGENKWIHNGENASDPGGFNHKFVGGAYGALAAGGLGLIPALMHKYETRDGKIYPRKDYLKRWGGHAPKEKEAASSPAWQRSAASMFGAKVAQDFDPAMSRDAENAIMHGTGLVGSAALGTAAGFPLTAGLGAMAERNNWIPDQDKNFLGNALVSTALKLPMFLGGTMGMSLYDNYILRPHMKRELARKQEEEQVRQMLQKQSGASLQRVLGTALASTGGGLLLGSYPGFKLQRASEAAGNSDFTNFVAGKAPIALSGALSAGLYNHWVDSYDKKKKTQAKTEPESVAKYLQYLVH